MSEQLAVTVSGVGEPLFILHGLFGASDNLGRVSKELESSFEVWRIDLRNHGLSFHSSEMNYSLMVEDVRKCMEDHDIKSAHFLGHSMGGKVAMQLALSYPESVKSLIVADIAPVKYPPHHQEIMKGLQSLDLKIVSDRKEADKCLAAHIENAGVRQFLLKSLIFSKNQPPVWRFNLEAIIEHYDDILDACDAEQPYRGKTLFIAGGLSDYIKPDYKDAILRLFPDASLKVIPQTSHWLHAEKPLVFAGICHRFLKDQKEDG